MQIYSSRNWPTLEEIVDRSPLQVTPNTSVLEAIDLMSRTGDSSCVLVADGGKLIGIFTERDVVKAVASGIDLSRTRIDLAILQPVISIALDRTQNVKTALSLMRQHRIRHLPAIDTQGLLVGLISQDRLDWLEEQKDFEFQESCVRWQALFENALDAIAITDDEGRYVDANPAACALFGLSKEEFLNSKVADFSDPEGNIDRLWQQFIQQGKLSGEFRLYCRDGTIRETEFTAVANFLPHHHLSILRDVTDRKQAEIALRQSEAKFRHFAENSHAVIWIAQPDSLDNLYVNPVYEKIWGRSCQSLAERPQSWLEAIHSEDRDRVQRKLEQQRQGDTSDVEYRIVRPDGSIRWIWDWGFPIRDERGQTYSYGGIAEDITDRKATESQLREREDFLSSIYNGVEQAVFVIEVTAIGEFSYLSFNRVSEQYAGLTEEQVRGKTPEEAFGTLIGTTFRQHYEDCLQAGRSISYEEELFFEGRTICTLTTLSPLRNQEGQVYRIVGTAINITDRKYSERALLELSAALENAVEGISRLDAGGNYLSVNKAYANTAGYFQTELIGKAWQITVYPEDLAKLEAAYQQMLGDGKVEVEARGIRKDGSLFYKQLVMISACDDRGNFKGHYCFMKDISDRKAAEVALRESEERYRTLFNSIDEGFCIIKILFDANDRPIDYRFLETNPAFEKLTGLQNVTGKTMREISPNIEEYWYETFGRVALTGEPARLTEQAKGIPEQGWFEVYAFQPNREERRKVALLFSDVTDRKLAEEKIVEQAALIDIATDAIFVRDLDNRILFWNRGAERLYGWTAEEALGKIASELFKPDSSSQPDEILSNCLERGFWQGELKHFTKSGQAIIVASRWTRVRDESGQPKSILVVNTDITEKKRIEEQFYHAQRLESIGTLASGIAHDFNNLLTPILAVSQLLPLKFPNLDEQTRQLLATVEDSAKRGANLVKQVLSFSRGTEGKRVIIQMRHLLEEVANVAQRTFPKSIEISQDIPTRKLQLISANSTQIHQVFMNLLVNARDAMLHGGHLTISAENCYLDENYTRMNWEANVGSYVVITISDTGIGIPPELIDRIFDPFFTTKEVGQGTGLGLATVLGIVRNHGGFVKVYSEVGKGTQFKVFLPAVEGKVSKSNLEKELPKGKGELILIVDDEQSIREITKTSLENYNYRTLVASDGIEAISTYAERKEEISLVLMDLMMPNLDGLTAIQALQKMNPQVKVIATSGLPASYQQALAANIKTFLLKPYTIEELLKALNKELSI